MQDGNRSMNYRVLKRNWKPESVKYCANHVQAHRQNWYSLFDQTRPRHIRFISFGFCTLFIYSWIICFVCFVSAEQEPSIPAPPESAEEPEESDGEFARGPNEARTRWKKRWMVILDILYLLRNIVMSFLCAEQETSFLQYMVVPLVDFFSWTLLR